MARIQRRRDRGRDHGVEAREGAGERIYPAGRGVRGLGTGPAGADPKPPRRPGKF